MNIRKVRNLMSRCRPFVLGSLAAGSLLTGPAYAQNQLITGKKITLPPVGTTQNVGSLPMNMIVSPNGQFALTTDMGFRQSLWSVSTTTGAGVSHIDFPGGAGVPNPTSAPATNGLYYGLAAADNGDGTSSVYAAKGANHSIAVISLNNTTGALTASSTITSAVNTDFPAGVAVFTQGGVRYLAVAMNDPYNAAIPFGVAGSLAIFNTSTRLEVGRYSFTNSYPVTSSLGALPTPNFPLAVSALSDGSRVYVSSQRDGGVYVLDASTPSAPALVTSVVTGAHPIGQLLNAAQTKLFVANAHSDTVTILNTGDNSTSTILLRPTGATTLAGATPTNLALSPDERTLYVTLGDMNAVAVVDLTRNAVTGYIPVGWYPTGVVATSRKKLLVSNAKGTQTRYPNSGYTLGSYNGSADYDLNRIEGNVEFLGVPNSTTLTSYTGQVIANNFITATTATPPNPLAGIGLSAGKITHVIYIVKENRTYDQVLGDLKDANGNPVGNGDSTLTLFGKTVTPNLHALALRFATLDNFYTCGEASGDGWPWSTQGMATEYVIKDLPYNYSGRGRSYDFEGTNNAYLVGGHPAKDPDGGTLSQLFPNGAPAIPDVSEAPAGHIWDNVLNNLNLTGSGLTAKYRNYGFFYSFGQARTNAPAIPDGYPASPGLQPAGHDLAGNSDWDFRKYDNDYPDSDAPNNAYIASSNSQYLYALTSFGKHNAPSRFSEWNNEFQQMLAKDTTGGTGVPAFMTVRFHHDHTQGFATNKHTPQAEVADNDYAVAQLVDAVSHSAIWNHTAIFVIEDDSQDGPDHVDAHRSPVFVISPYIKQNSVDHTFYNTDSVLKTMELLLGLPPMNQYDAIANPILDWDATPSNGALYTALPEDNVILLGKNGVVGLKKNDPRVRLAQLSDKMDFTHPDSADPRLLNEILWKSIKGVNSKMPAPRHSVMLTTRHTAQKTNGKQASKNALAPGKAPVTRHDDDDD